MSLVSTWRKFRSSQDFNPGFAGIFINPFYIARKGLYRSIAKLAPAIDGNVLDVGCGKKPYRSLFRCDRYIGLDIENPGHNHDQEDIDVFYDGKKFPFADGEFDNALCNQVLEHVFEPEEFLQEINRVMKPGGHLLLTVPFVWDEHEQPNDYARYSSFGLTALLKRNGFEVVKFEKSVNDIRVMFQLMICYIFKKTISRIGAINIITTFFLIAPVTLVGNVLGFILPANADLYLDNVVLLKKK